MRPLIILVVLALGLHLVSNAAGSPSIIVFDTSTGFFGIDSESSVGMSLLRDELMLEGFDATDNVLLNIEADEITSSLLSRSRVLVLVNPSREFDKREIDLIKDFVYNGGKLLLVSDTPESSEYMNDVSRIFGVEFLGHYFLGDNLPLEYRGNMAYLISPIPLDVRVEPEVSLQSGQVDARAWFSVWERPGDIIKRDNFTVFAGVRYGKGSVAFLGDKDILLNGNIVKGGNLQFVKNIFNWFIYDVPEETDTEIAYFPAQLNFVVEEGKRSVATLIIENRGNVNQTLRFKVPPYLTEMISIDKGVLDIPPGETMMVWIEMIGIGDYSYISDFIIVEREYDYYKREDYIPIEVLSQT
jgi:hypothetical protein